MDPITRIDSTSLASTSTVAKPKAPSKPKARRRSLLANVELVPEGDKPFRRSRTGCLTCRKRKKKCPEQYEKGSCLRCKAGGWKCIKEEDMPAADSDEMRLRRTGSRPVEGVAGQTQVDAFPGQGPSQSGPSGINITDNAIFDYDMTSGPSLDIVTENNPFELDQQTAVNTDFWSGQSLEELLGASLPDFDLSALYGSTFDTQMPVEPFRFSPGVNLDIPIYENQENAFSAGMFPGLTFSDPGTSSPSNLKPTEDVVLERFYDRYILPAWSVTYPDKVRKVVIARYQEIVKNHNVTRLCQKAASAAYLTLLRRKITHPFVSIGYNQNSVSSLPPEYLNLSLDAENILREATLMVRSPKDDNITMEAHFWALSDLHMAVGSFSEPPHGYAIMEIAERLLSMTYGPSPQVDFLSLKSYIPFYMRAFAMIDLNRSICQRRHSFFSFVDTIQIGMTSHVNDGSHDNWFGLPAGLVIPLSSASNLIVKVRDPTGALIPEAIAVESKAIEHSLVTYRSAFAVTDNSQSRHPREWAAEMAVETEIWRNLGLLLLWRFVNNTSALAPQIRQCVNLLLDLLKSLQYLSSARIQRESSLIDFWSLNYTTPMFLVGSLLVDVKDREYCRQFLKSIGAEKNLEDMVVVLEATWQATDRIGQVADWFEQCRKLDLAITFF